MLYFGGLGLSRYLNRYRYKRAVSPTSYTERDFKTLFENYFKKLKYSYSYSLLDSICYKNKIVFVSSGKGSQLATKSTENQLNKIRLVV